MVSKIDMNFFNSCKNNELTQARKALYSGQVSSQNIVRCAGEVLLQHGNKGFVQECLAYLQSKRPNDPYAKALQVILLVQDKKYSEAFEMIKSGVPSITFDYLVGIAKKRVGTREQLEINGFLELCLDHIDLKNFYEDDEYRRELITDGFHYKYEESLGYFVNLALNYQRTDFVQGCLDEFDKNDILLMIQDDEQYSKYLKEVISEDKNRIRSYIFHIGHKSMDLETKKKHLKRFVDTMMTLYPETFPVLLSRVVVPEHAYLLDVLEPELLHQVALHSQEKAYYAKMFSKCLNEERQLILLSKATGLPLKNAKGDGYNEDLKLLLSRLDQGKDGKLTFCQCIRELNSFTPSEREFYVALLTGDQEKALKLAKSGKVNVYKTLGNKTALMHAMDYGSDELISYLLRREGLNPDLKAYTKKELTTIYNLSGDKDKNGRPLIVYALEKAIKEGKFATAKMLIAKGANLDLKDASGNSGYTILDANIENIVKMKGDIGIEFLKSIPNYSPIIPLLTDKQRYDIGLIEKMVSKGIDINTVCARTQKTALETFLFEAPHGSKYEEDNLSMFQELLYLHPRDKKGVPIIQNATSIIHWSASRPRILKSLLAYGVDIDTTNDKGQTALAEAMESSYFSSAESLLVHGADSTHSSLGDDKMPERSLIRVHKNKGEFKDRPNEEFYIDWMSSDVRFNLGYPEMRVENDHINMNCGDKPNNKRKSVFYDFRYDRTPKEDRIVSTIMYGTVDEVEQLLSDSKSYSVNKIYYGYTPLMWAVLAGRADMVKMMLEHNPNLKIPSVTDGYVVFELAAKCNNPHIYKIFDDYAKNTPGIDGIRGLVNQESENLQDLIQAIKDGDVERVKKITARMPRLNIQDSQGNTPLRVACEMLASVAVSDEKWCTREKMSTYHSIFCHLLEKGADVTYGYGNEGESPMMILFRALPKVKDRRGVGEDGCPHKFLCMEDAIGKGIKSAPSHDFYIADSTGNTPLHYAIKGQAWSVVDNLYGRCKENPNLLNYKNNYQSARDLLLHLKDNNLIECAYPPYAEGICEKYLALPTKPSWKVPDKSGRQTPKVSDRPYDDVLELSRKDPDFQGLLERDGMYAKVDSTDQTFQVLKAITSETKDTLPLLVYAVKNLNPEFLRVLIEAGVDVNQKTSKGITVLDHVIYKLNEQATLDESKRDANYIAKLTEIAALLKKAGAKEGPHPKCQLSEEAKKLKGVAAAFGLDRASEFSQPILFEAIGREDITDDEFRSLIANGADVNATDEEGNTPLHEAIMYGYDDLVEILLESNAKVNKTNKNGMTPLDYVIYNLNEQAELDESERNLEYIKDLKEIAVLLKKAGGVANAVKLSKKAKKLDGVTAAFRTKAEPNGETLTEEEIEAKRLRDEKVLKQAFKTLIGKNRANLRAVDPEDKTSLLLKVIETGDADLVCSVIQASTITAEALLEKGPYGLNAIQMAYQTGNDDIIKAMEEAMTRTGVVLEDYKKTCQVLAATREETFGVLEDALKREDQKLDLRVQDQDGKTILHHLAEKGQTDLILQALASQRNPGDSKALTIPDKNGNTPLDLLPAGDAKTKFVTDLLLKEAAKQEQNDTLITELLEQLDKKTLEELKKNPTIKGNKDVTKLIDDKLTAKAPEVTATRTAARETPVSTNIAARLAENSEQNITTIQGNDGVALSYTSSKGRA